MVPGGAQLPGICYDFAGTAGSLVVDAPPGVNSPFTYLGQKVAAVITFGTGVANGVPGGTINGIATFYDFINSGTLASETSYFHSINPLQTLVLQDNYPAVGKGAMYTPTPGEPGYNQYFGEIPYYFVLGAIAWPQSAIPQLQGVWGKPADDFLTKTDGTQGDEWEPFLVPEPSAMSLLLLAFGIGAARRLRKMQVS